MASDRKASRTSESIDGPIGLLSLCLLLSLIHHAPAVQSFQPVSLPQQLLQPPPSSIRCNKSPIALHALSQRQTFLLDGGELESFLVHNNDHNAATIAAGNAVASPRNAHKGVGCLSFVTGTTDDQKRIVGVEQLGSEDDAGTNYETISLGDGIHVYKHTVAVIPERVSDMDAISTAAASVVGVHCAIPRVGGVGGSDDGVVFGKVGDLFVCVLCVVLSFS